MAYHPRIETAKFKNFLTTRTRNSELWFVNNKPLEESILGSAARCAERYSVKLFALAIEGNHIQGVADFPGLNRSSFMRDFNSSVTRAVVRHVPEYPGGTMWGRRYSNEFLPTDNSILRQFLYTVLQPVQDGLIEKLSDSPFYNCLHDAAWGIRRKFKVVRWAEYNSALRWNTAVMIKDFTDTVELKYERIPGFEHLSRDEYARMIFDLVEERRKEIVAERRAQGLGFAGRAYLLSIVPGSKPVSTKTSTRKDFRPRFLSGSKKVNDECTVWYFDMYFTFKNASKRYRAGELDVEFPPGMYRPYLPSALAPPRTVEYNAT
jgi:REP element-mobilizing transposase RayT